MSTENNRTRILALTEDGQLADFEAAEQVLIDPLRTNQHRQITSVLGYDATIEFCRQITDTPTSIQRKITQEIFLELERWRDIRSTEGNYEARLLRALLSRRKQYPRTPEDDQAIRDIDDRYRQKDLVKNAYILRCSPEFLRKIYAEQTKLKEQGLKVSLLKENPNSIPYLKLEKDDPYYRLYSNS